jgi:CelD/BcsL family acetyltransferase involved in cellulose biosynthesis
MKSEWEINTYQTWDEVDDPDFIAQWEIMMEESSLSHVFVHPCMIKSWTDTYRGLWNINPLYIVAKKQDVTAFLPLLVWKRNWNSAALKVIIPAGYRDYDYHDPVVKGPLTESLISSFWEVLNEKVLNRSVIDFDEIDMFGVRNPGNNSFWEVEEDCPFIDLTEFEDYEFYLGKLGKNLRKDIRRRIRMLQESGIFDFHIYCDDELEEALKILPLFLETHDKKWSNNTKESNLYKSILKNCLSAGLVHFSEIRIDGKPISWELGFRYKQRAYSYMPAYMSEYARYSPGKVHLSCLIEDGFKNGIEIFDFMRGAEEYKGDWTQYQQQVYQYNRKEKGIKSSAKLRAYDIIQNLRNRI